MQKLMKARDLSKHLSIPIQMIYRRTRDGTLPHYRIGRSVRYKVSEVEEALKVKPAEDNDVQM